MKDLYNINFLTHKPYLSKKETESYILLKLLAPAKISAGTRNELNIVFAIDVSGSMDERASNDTVTIKTNGYWAKKPKPLWPDLIPSTPKWINNTDYTIPQIPEPFDYNNHNINPGPDYIWIEGSSYQKHVSKLDRVKEAVTTAIQKLNVNDSFSIVTFANDAQVIFSSSKATETNKQRALQAIQTLRAAGGTALHSGWKLGAEQVCNGMTPLSLNRVLLLTDGEANIGIKDADTLCSHVNGLSEHKVSTSTFGVGQSFNEDLLTGMSEAGDGQYYYLSDSDNISASFEEEFSGLSQLFSSNLRMNVTSNFGIVEVMNTFKQNEDIYYLPNGIRGNELHILLKVKYSTGDSKNNKHMALKASINYEDASKKQRAQTIDIEIPFGTAKQVDSAFENAEVAKKILAFEAAKAKREAMKALDAGDFQTSNSILRGATMMMCASAYSADLSSETQALNTLVAMSDSGVDNKKLRKMALYEAYNNDRSKT